MGTYSIVGGGGEVCQPPPTPSIPPHKTHITAARIPTQLQGDLPTPLTHNNTQQHTTTLQHYTTTLVYIKLPMYRAIKTTSTLIVIILWRGT
jgi:hypothetical protein